MKKIILASKSERRKELMKKAGYDFVIIPSSFELDINNKNYSDELLKKCVKGKLEDVKNKISDDDKELYIVAADTVVVLDNVIIGKPKDRNDAIKILKSLSGKTHFVATGVEVLYKNDNILQESFDISKTYVTFRNLDDKEILKYIDEKKPYDKAGSYGIQDEGFDFHIKVKGDMDNVIGLPMGIIKKYIK